MVRIICLVLVAICLIFTPEVLAAPGGGGGGGGGGSGASVPALHVIGQLLLVLCIALWARKSK